MMHVFNEINRFSWITNLILQAKPPLKQSPTRSSRAETKERGEGTMREKVERERGERREERDGH